MDVKYKFDPQMYKIVGKNIAAFRQKRNLAIEELSKYADIKATLLKKYEKGESTISIYELYKISIILNYSIDQFFN